MAAQTEWPREGGPRKTPYRYYFCYRTYKRAGINTVCHNRRVYGTKKLHPFVRQALEALRFDDKGLMSAVRQAPPVPVDRSKELAVLEKRQGRAREAYMGSVWTLAEYAVERDALDAQKAALLNQQDAPQPTAGLGLAEARVLLNQALKHEDLTDVVRALGLRLTLYDDGRLDLHLDPP